VIWYLLSQNKVSTHQELSLGYGILGYGIFAILFLGIWDMCPLNYWNIALSFWVLLGIFLAFDRKSILGIWDICPTAYLSNVVGMCFNT
jgi:hypothetical protein